VGLGGTGRRLDDGGVGLEVEGQRLDGNGHVLLADAEKAADAYDDGEKAPVAVDQEVVDSADGLAFGAGNLDAHDRTGEHLVLGLAGEEVARDLLLGGGGCLLGGRGCLGRGHERE
jgi:hypothetical protein